MNRDETKMREKILEEAAEELARLFVFQLDTFSKDKSSFFASSDVKQKKRASIWENKKDQPSVYD